MANDRLDTFLFGRTNLRRNVESTRLMMENREFQKVHVNNMAKLKEFLQTKEAPVAAAAASFKTAQDAFTHAEENEKEARGDEMERAADRLGEAHIRSLMDKQDAYMRLAASENPFDQERAKELVTQNLAMIQQVATLYQSQSEIEARQEAAAEREITARRGQDIEAEEARGRLQLGREEVQLGREELGERRRQFDALAVPKKLAHLTERINLIRSLQASGVDEDTIGGLEELGLPAGMSITDVLDQYQGFTEERRAELKDIESRIKREETRIEGGAGSPDRLQRMKEERSRLEKIDDAIADQEIEARQFKQDRNLAERTAVNLRQKLRAVGEGAVGLAAFPYFFLRGLGVPGPEEREPEKVVREEVKAEF